MTSNVVLMSSVPRCAIDPEFGALNEAKPERMLAGFPWVSAIVFYTLSWGLSLLRPNTLYWDDWSFYFRQPIGNARNVCIQMGRPLWEGSVEIAILQVGTWAVCVATFILFFSTGILLFCILKTFVAISSANLRCVTFVFYRTVCFSEIQIGKKFFAGVCNFIFELFYS